MRHYELGRVGAAALILAALSACSEPPPSATDVLWAVEQKADKTYHLTGSANVQQGLGGWYTPLAELVDDRGCRHAIYLPATHVANTDLSGQTQAVFDQVLDVARPIATASLRIIYQESSDGTVESITDTSVFSGDKTLDSALNPPSVPTKPCNDRVRGSGGAGPNETDAATIAGMPRNEILATAINSAGFLCAKVRDAYPVRGGIEVSCTEYRSGKGRAKYKIDTSEMSVTKI